jgi:translation initiation factor IF-3
VQIAYKDDMPIAQLLDYGKYKYQQHKKQMEAKKKQPKNVVKEIRLSPRIDPHDIQIKINQISEFIKSDYTVRVSMNFKGRENTHKNIGIQIMETFKTIPGTTYSELTSIGNQIILTLVKSNQNNAS